MKNYYYTITLHVSSAIALQVQDFVLFRIIPTWQEYPHWTLHQALQRVISPNEEMSAYTLSWEVRDLPATQQFAPEADPLIARLCATYPQQVFPIAVLLQEL